MNIFNALLIVVLAALGSSAQATNPAPTQLRSAEVIAGQGASAPDPDAASAAASAAFGEQAAPPGTGGPSAGARRGGLAAMTVDTDSPRPPALIPAPSAGAKKRAISPEMMIYGAAGALGASFGIMKLITGAAVGSSLLLAGVGALAGVGVAYFAMQGDVGAAYGIALGAIVGSFFAPALGTAIGAVAGGVIGHFAGKLFGGS